MTSYSKKHPTKIAKVLRKIERKNFESNYIDNSTNQQYFKNNQPTFSFQCEFCRSTIEYISTEHELKILVKSGLPLTITCQNCGQRTKVQII